MNSVLQHVRTASAGTPERGSSWFPRGANRITVSLARRHSRSKWTTTAGELVTPYGSGTPHYAYVEKLGIPTARGILAKQLGGLVAPDELFGLGIKFESAMSSVGDVA